MWWLKPYKFFNVTNSKSWIRYQKLICFLELGESVERIKKKIKEGFKPLLNQIEFEKRFKIII